VCVKQYVKSVRERQSVCVTTTTTYRLRAIDKRAHVRNYARARSQQHSHNGNDKHNHNLCACD
jgi:hypothetical protein